MRSKVKVFRSKTTNYVFFLRKWWMVLVFLTRGSCIHVPWSNVNWFWNRMTATCKRKEEEEGEEDEEEGFLRSDCKLNKTFTSQLCCRRERLQVKSIPPKEINCESFCDNQHEVKYCQKKKSWRNIGNRCDQVNESDFVTGFNCNQQQLSFQSFPSNPHSWLISQISCC